VVVNVFFIPGTSELIAYNQLIHVCLCVCVLTMVPLIISAGRRLVIMHGYPDTHSGQPHRTFPTQIPPMNNYPLPEKFFRRNHGHFPARHSPRNPSRRFNLLIQNTGHFSMKNDPPPQIIPNMPAERHCLWAACYNSSLHSCYSFCSLCFA